MVYRERLADPWHCSWCDFTHDDFEKVVKHENSEHGGRKRNEQKAMKKYIVANAQNVDTAGIFRWLNGCSFLWQQEERHRAVPSVKVDEYCGKLVSHNGRSG